MIAQRLRGAVAQQLSFTCSAGIGPNKLLAKIGSAKNKPNKQTVVLPRAIDSLMQVRGVLCAAAAAAARAQRVNCTAVTLPQHGQWSSSAANTDGALCCTHDASVVFSTLQPCVYTHVCLLRW